MSMFDMDVCRCCGAPVGHQEDYCDRYPECRKKTYVTTPTPERVDTGVSKEELEDAAREIVLLVAKNEAFNIPRSVSEKEVLRRILAQGSKR